MKIGNFYLSRKILLALVGVIQTIVLHYCDIPQDIWVAIDALIIAVIGGIAIEDAGAKSAQINVVPGTLDE